MSRLHDMKVGKPLKEQCVRYKYSRGDKKEFAATFSDWKDELKNVLISLFKGDKK